MAYGRGHVRTLGFKCSIDQRPVQEVVELEATYPLCKVTGAPKSVNQSGMTTAPSQTNSGMKLNDVCKWLIACSCSTFLCSGGSKLKVTCVKLPVLLSAVNLEQVRYLSSL